MNYTSAHGVSPSVSHRLDHEVSLQGAGRRVAGADTNDYPAGVQRTGRPDRIRRFVARTCPYVRGNSAAYCRQRLRAARQGTVIASGPDGVPGLAQALLGAAFLGSGLLLHHQRQHHGRCHTSVSSGARTYRRQPVVSVSYWPRQQPQCTGEVLPPSSPALMMAHSRRCQTMLDDRRREN